MRCAVFVLVIVCTLLCAHAQNWKRAGTTRYWDCSKPHCAWKNIPPNNHASELPFRHEYAFKRCNNCAMGAKYFGTAAAATSIMGGDQNSAACGKCYALRSLGSSEVKLVLQVNNLCPGNSNPSCRRDHFDIAVPGFDWNDASVSNTCRQNDPALLYRGNEQACMRSPVKSCNCDAVSSDPVLVEGCKLFVELGWDNQEVEYTEVNCPGSSDVGGSGGFSPPLPPPPSGGGSCNQITPAFDTSNEWWVEFTGPNGNVQLECTGANWQLIQCSFQWGKWTCAPQGKPCAPDYVSARNVIVNGQKCRLSARFNAASDEESLLGESFDLNLDTSMTDDTVIDSAVSDDAFLEASIEAALADDAVTESSMGEETQVIEDAFADSSMVDAAVSDFVLDASVTESSMGEETQVIEDAFADSSVVDAAVSDSSMDMEMVDTDFDATADVTVDYATPIQQTQDTSSAQTAGTPAWAIGIIVVASVLLVLVVVLAVLLVRISKH